MMKTYFTRHKIPIGSRTSLKKNDVSNATQVDTKDVTATCSYSHVPDCVIIVGTYTMIHISARTLMMYISILNLTVK